MCPHILGFYFPNTNLKSEKDFCENFDFEGHMLGVGKANSVKICEFSESNLTNKTINIILGIKNKDTSPIIKPIFLCSCSFFIF